MRVVRKKLMSRCPLCGKVTQHCRCSARELRDWGCRQRGFTIDGTCYDARELVEHYLAQCPGKLKEGAGLRRGASRVRGKGRKR